MSSDKTNDLDSRIAASTINQMSDAQKIQYERMAKEMFKNVDFVFQKNYLKF